MQENNWNDWNNWNNEQQTPPPYYPYGAPEPERKGFAIASLVLGILSLVLCCVGGGVLGIVGLILGIVSLSKKGSKMGMAIAGIITSAFGIVFGIAMLIYVIMFAGYFTEHYDDIMNSAGIELYESDAYILGDDEAILGENESEVKDTVKTDEEDPFMGNSFVAGDGSVIYFEENGTFVWYQDDTDHEDYYCVGTYDCYRAEFAESYIMTYLDEYGVTEDELEEYYERNNGSEFYTDENFTCLVLHNESRIIDGEEQVTEPYDTNYMGFYMDGYYDAANMASGSYVVFTEQ